MAIDRYQGNKSSDGIKGKVGHKTSGAKLKCLCNPLPVITAYIVQDA